MRQATLERRSLLPREGCARSARSSRCAVTCCAVPTRSCAAARCSKGEMDDGQQRGGECSESERRQASSLSPSAAHRALFSRTAQPIWPHHVYAPTLPLPRPFSGSHARRDQATNSARRARKLSVPRRRRLAEHAEREGTEAPPAPRIASCGGLRESEPAADAGDAAC
jgi:hypothetical protein